LAQGKQVETCRRGHPRTPENTYTVTNGKRRKRQCLICKRVSDRRWAKNNARKKHPRERLRVPAEPFAKWLSSVVEKHNGHDVAFMTGLNQRTVWRITNRIREGDAEPRVHIDIVDTALQNYGGPEMLHDLYPGLYEDS
jgi:hypothetical protein